MMCKILEDCLPTFKGISPNFFTVKFILLCSDKINNVFCRLQNSIIHGKLLPIQNSVRTTFRLNEKMTAGVLKGLEGNEEKKEKHNQPARHQLITL